MIKTTSLVILFLALHYPNHIFAEENSPQISSISHEQIFREAYSQKINELEASQIPPFENLDPVAQDAMIDTMKNDFITCINTNKNHGLCFQSAGAAVATYYHLNRIPEDLRENYLRETIDAASQYLRFYYIKSSLKKWSPF